MILQLSNSAVARLLYSVTWRLLLLLICIAGFYLEFNRYSQFPSLICQLTTLAIILQNLRGNSLAIMRSQRPEIYQMETNCSEIGLMCWWLFVLASLKTLTDICKKTFIRSCQALKQWFIGWLHYYSGRIVKIYSNQKLRNIFILQLLFLSGVRRPIVVSPFSSLLTLPFVLSINFQSFQQTRILF